MNIESLIKKRGFELKAKNKFIEIAPDIDENHKGIILQKNSSSIDKSILDNALVLSFSITGWFFFTGSHFYYDNFSEDGVRNIKFKNIASVSNCIKSKWFSLDELYIKEYDGVVHALDACVDGSDIEGLLNLFNLIITIANKYPDSEFTCSKQGILTYELTEEIKLLYLKLLCNFAFINDKIIGPQEYHSIARYSIRMELSKDDRVKLVHYMMNYQDREKSGYLIQKIKKLTLESNGQWEAIRFCLMQDILSMIHKKDDKADWRENGFVGSLMEALELSPKQLDVMDEAVLLNSKMEMKGADMPSLKKEWKQLVDSNKNLKSYISPIYLFCSGSIYGIKSYHAFFKTKELNQEEINKYREIILTELITNMQKSINLLIDEISHISTRLKKEIEEINNVKDSQNRTIELMDKFQKMLIINQQKQQELEVEKEELDENQKRNENQKRDEE